MNSSPLTNLFDMAERRQEWEKQKPVYGNNNELRFSKEGGELVFGYFVSSGEDADRFFTIYKAHSVDTVTKKGVKISVQRYCPPLTGTGEECSLCDEGNTAIKDRMSMWLYVAEILHTNLPPEKKFDTLPYGGRTYYREPVNDFRLWHTSAWRESPFDDIVRFHTMFKGLHNFMVQMAVTGAGTTRRYKMYNMPPNTERPELDHFPEEIYKRALEELKPIPEILRESIGSPVQQAPTQNTTDQSTRSTGFMEAFRPSAPSAPPEELPPIQPEKDSRRPLQSMF